MSRQTLQTLSDGGRGLASVEDCVEEEKCNLAIGKIHCQCEQERKEKLLKEWKKKPYMDYL